MQRFDATPYRGQTIRLRAWLRLERVERSDTAQMWLRVDRENGEIGLFDNMHNRPVARPNGRVAKSRAACTRTPT